MTYIFFKVKEIIIGVKESPNKKRNQDDSFSLSKHGETAYN